MGLADYKGIIGTAASISSFCLLLSPSILCFKIWQKGTSQDIPFFPIIESAARSLLILQQGILMNVTPLIITHSIGLILNISYITIYLSFTKDKTEAKKYMLKWSAIVFPLIAYANYEDRALVETRYGNLVTLFSSTLLLMHVMKIRQVIKTQNTKDLPFPILVAVACVTLLWSLYGYTINKHALLYQTGPAFCVAITELSLFAIYPSKPDKKDKKN